MRINRREMIKSSSMLSLGYSLPIHWMSPKISRQNPEAKNIIVLVFDTFSALHLSMLGYPRNTDGNIKRFADRATVYHNHFTAGTFTTSGTASILTGVHPFTHRALHFYERVIPAHEKRNLFFLFDEYYRLAYTHNHLANVLLKQFADAIDNHKKLGELYFNNSIINNLFSNDEDISYLSWSRIINESNETANSLFISKLYSQLYEGAISLKENEFPRGVPRFRGQYFTLEQAIDWIMMQLPDLPQPYMVYFHLAPPHDPYNTRSYFIDVFKNDGYKAVKKPNHYFEVKDIPEKLDVMRQKYDEYILYVDAEFGRLYEYMESNNILDDTWLVFTSDHGEMFERGIFNHKTPAMFQSLVRVPLMISAPGQMTREDIQNPTSSVDLLPTLLHLSGKPVPAWCEGQVLPPYASEAPDPQRSIYAFDAKRNQRETLAKCSAMLLEWPYKLMMFKGYPQSPGEDWFYYEMYDIEQDPEELENIYTDSNVVGQHLVEKLLARLKQADEPYEEE